MRDPTDLELKLGALGIPDDVSFYVWRDGAVQATGNGNWEQNYEAWCRSIFPPGFGKDGVPQRIHNLGSPNVWGYPPGPACCQNLPPLPPGPLLQSQIEAINACVPVNTVIVSGEAAKQAARATWEAVKSKIPPKQPA